jgi:iron complex outermembrane receptor protein
MSAFFRSSLFLLCAAGLARAQTVLPPAATAGDHIEHLDKFVVSAGHDPKTMFDLAQGTSVLAGEELHRLAQSTLGETLATTPGVSSTYYGPGSSRPVIRGLGGDRVRVLDNGVGALDASNVSPDHNTAIEPLFASRIEVLRGPSTLLYGSSAIGGAVNVIDNAIPDEAGDGRPSGALEVRGGGAARERAGVLSVGGGGKHFVVRVNALRQTTGDLRIPGVARIDADAPRDQPAGVLPGSSGETFSGSFGMGLFLDAGRYGTALHHYETEYGVPNGDDIRIRMRQTRWDFEGEVTRAFGPFRGAKARFGRGSYTHSEIEGRAVNTTFDNEAWEGRLELPHVPVGPVTGTIGLQAARSDFAARGAEVVTPPSLTESGAVFALEELKLGGRATLQLGGRLESQRIRLGEVDPALPALPGYGARTGQEKKFLGAGASTGLVVYPVKDWSVGLTLAYSERLPTAQELFANGPHGGTGAYEVGTPGLGRERSVGLDLSVRRRAGFVTGAVGAFVHRFRDYIYEEEMPAAAIPAARNPDELTPYRFVAADARFAGGEVELLFHLVETEHSRLHLEFTADSVRARQTTADTPLPRIPPVRLGTRLSYEDGRWHLLAEARRTQRQDRIAANETATPGHTQINASVSYLIPSPHVTYELFVRGRNLTNQAAREHGSFLKEFAPLPGRGVLGGVRLTF